MQLIRCPAVVVFIKILFVSRNISPTGGLPVIWTDHSNELFSNEDDVFQETLEQELHSPLKSKDDDIENYTSIEGSGDNAANSSEGSGSGESNIAESISSGYGSGGSEAENESGEHSGSATESGNGNGSGSGSGSAEESGSGESDDEEAKENHPSDLVIGEGNMSGEGSGVESSSENKGSGEGADGSNSAEGSGEVESGSGLIVVNNGLVVLGGGVLRIPTSEPVHSTTAVIDDPLSALLQFMKEMQALPYHRTNNG